MSSTVSSHAALQAPGAASTKVISRQNRARGRIQAESTRLFLAHGFASVSVDAIVAAAEVARSSFYRFFANREEVLASIIRPVFESGAAMLDDLDGQPPREIVDGVLRTYLQMWSTGPDTMRLAFRTGGVHFVLFEDVHRRFRERLTSLMHQVASAGLLLNDSATSTARIIARTAVPVLEVYRDDPRGEILFRQAMNGLLIKPEARS